MRLIIISHLVMLNHAHHLTATVPHRGRLFFENSVFKYIYFHKEHKADDGCRCHVSLSCHNDHTCRLTFSAHDIIGSLSCLHTKRLRIFFSFLTIIFGFNL